jgi:hypothetical protein
MLTSIPEQFLGLCVASKISSRNPLGLLVSLTVELVRQHQLESMPVPGPCQINVTI